MKRFTGLLCVLSLLAGLVSGLCLTSVKGVKADDEIRPGKVTVLYFSDKSFTDFNSTARIQSVDMDDYQANLSVGGNCQWTHGVLIIEPNEGWSVSEIAGMGSIDADSLTTLDQVISTVGNNAGDGGIPDSVQTLFDSYSATASQTQAVYIGRQQYLSMSDAYIDLVSNEDTATVNLNRSQDEFYCEDLTVDIGDSFDVFTLTYYGSQPLTGYNRSDYTIDVGTRNNSNENALSACYSSQNDDNYGVFEAAGRGEFSVNLTNTKNGLRYHAAVTMTSNMPLRMEDFSAGAGAEFLRDSTEDTGVYRISPVGKYFFSEITVRFTLPDGATLKTLEFEDRSIKGVSSVPIYDDYDGLFGGSAINGAQVSATIRSTLSNYAIDGFLVAVITAGGTDYEYRMKVIYRNAIDVSVYGEQLTSVSAGSMLDLADFLRFSDSNDRQTLYDGITSGRFELDMRGVEPLMENGVFRGKLTVFYPSSRLTIYDNTSSTRLCSSGVKINVKASTVIEAGTTFDMSTLLNGYWDNNNVSVTDRSSAGYTLSDDNKIFHAPASVTSVAQYVITSGNTGGTGAEIKISVCPAGTLMDSLTDVAASVGSKENLVVDVANGASVSSDTLNSYRQNGGNDSSIIIRNRNSSHSPEWHFNKNDLSGAADRDIDLNIAVGNELVNPALDRVGGLKVGFASNGTLPGRAGVRLYLSSVERALFSNLNRIQLYYFNEQGRLVRESSNFYVCKDTLGRYYIDIVVTHNSDFVLSSTDTDVLTAPAYDSGSSYDYDDTPEPTPEPEPEPAADRNDTEKDTSSKKEDETTVTKNEDGSVTTSVVSEKENGQITTTTTVTDDSGSIVSETVTDESVTKRGTKVEETETVFANGASEYSLSKEYKDGSVEETKIVTDTKGSATVTRSLSDVGGDEKREEFSISAKGLVKVEKVEINTRITTVPGSITVDGKKYPVTVISKGAYAGSGIEKVTIPAGITTIGKKAFADAAGLKTIIFKAANVKKISQGAFDGIAEKPTFKIKAGTRSEYKKMVKLIKKAGVRADAEFTWVK